MVVVDEMMVAFKGRLKLQCYMLQKPTKSEYKLWLLAGVSGYVFNFEIVGENGVKGPPPGELVINGVSESSYIVWRLAYIFAEKKYKFFFDNYFASPELYVYLKEKKFCFYIQSK